jgi:hypothetical protein
MNSEFFTTQSMNAWLVQAASQPVPRKLFGECWCEGELSILFSDTGLGKSALATQIANGICTGQPISPEFAIEAAPQPVLYFDFELTEMQLQKRYAVEQREGGCIAYAAHYPFSDRLQRVAINCPSQFIDAVKEWEAPMLRAIEKEILTSDAKIVVIDNISYLTSEADKGKFALPLMHRLNDLKKQHGLAILVLAHTPKLYFTHPLSLDDLAGSKILSNFADSIFALGKSQQDANLRYLKQLKARSTDLIYRVDNVALLRFEKEHNFLGFEFVSCGNEYNHLAPQSSDQKALLIESVKRLSTQGKTQRQIAHELDIAVGTVNKYLTR